MDEELDGTIKRLEENNKKLKIKLEEAKNILQRFVSNIELVSDNPRENNFEVFQSAKYFLQNTKGI